MPQGDQGLQIVIDPLEWARFKKQLDASDVNLARILRRRIRNAALVGAESVKGELKEATPTGKALDGEAARNALIQATKVTVSFATRAAGARIVTGAGNLPAAQKGLLRVYNKTTFRHPVFETGDQGTARHFFSGSTRSRQKLGRDGTLAPWVSEQGHPYFNAGIYKVLDTAMIAEIRAALDDAAKSIGATAL